MIKEIEKKIKEKHGTKRKFCHIAGHDPKDLSKKFKILLNKAEWINRFLKPVNLELTLKNKEDED